VVGALLIDAETVYDPSLTNDRLLLGMKGTISEMELASFASAHTRRCGRKPSGARWSGESPSDSSKDQMTGSRKTRMPGSDRASI